MRDDDRFMAEALEEARLAAKRGEVPVGAVVVLEGEVIARGHNRREETQDATAHAEMLALREACRRQGSWRLNGAELYVTLEPCPMCAGALVQARVARLVYGTPDPKAGAAGTLVNLLEDDRFNHRVAVTSGVRQSECAEMLRQFFRSRRGQLSEGCASG